MGEKICRLCLQVIGENVPYFALGENSVVLGNLNILFSEISKSIGLVEDSIVCNLCCARLKKLVKYKDIVTRNETKIESNQNDLNTFLETLSKNTQTLCRLCLKPFDKLEKGWQDRKKLIKNCGIHLNGKISSPTKICDVCDVTFEVWQNFNIQCSDNNKLVIELANKQGGKLTSKDLVTISSKQCLIEDKNKILPKARKKEQISTTIMKQEEKKQKSNKKAKERETEKGNKKAGSSSAPSKKMDSNDTIIKMLTKGLKDGLDNLKKKEGSPMRVVPEEELLTVTRTPNTYKKRKSSAKNYYPNLSPDLPSTSQEILTPNHILHKKFILKKMNEQLRKMHTSIDASPVSNLADITLDLDEEGMVQEEPTSEYNATQELIDVLEGRLNDTQELLAFAECDKTTGIREKQDIVVTLQVEPKPFKGKGVTHPKTFESTSKPSDKKPVNIIGMVTIPVEKEADKPLGRIVSASLKLKKKDLTQTTLLTSFSGILQKNLEENNAISETQKQTSSMIVPEEPVQREGKKRKAAKKTSNESNKDSDITSSPKKTARKAPTRKKQASTDTQNTEDIKGSKVTEEPPKKRARKPTEKRNPSSVDKPAVEVVPIGCKEEVIETESARILERNNENDQLIEKGGEKQVEIDRPVVIIKSQKRTKKSLLDKTWKELTGVKLASGSTDIGGGVEIEVVKKKRGRPPLSEGQKKPKEKSTTVWLYCEACPFKTYSQTSFVQHQLVHNLLLETGVQTLNCDICRFTTTNAEALSVHKMSHETDNLTYKCAFCDQVFRKKSSAMYHTLKHDDQDIASQFYCVVYNRTTDEEYFECYQCEYQNPDESAMPDHVIDHTIEKPKNPILARFKCDTCPYRTKSEEALARHIKLHQMEEERKSKKMVAKNKVNLKGETGAAIVKTEPSANQKLAENIKKEMDQGNESQEEGEDRPLIKCGKCHYVTRHRRSLANHIGLKHNRKVLPIDAGIEAKARAERTNAPLYYCNECSYSTYRKMNLPRHALVHRTKENMVYFECPHCLFESKHRRSYTRHMEVKHGLVA